MAGRFAWLALIVAIAWLAYSRLPKEGPAVDIGAVSTIYPSQAFTLLNASGYVVPQTKADVASKATGRLERLDVREGSVVKAGQILAVIENADLIAGMHQAAANVQVAKTNLKKAEAELREATLALSRARALAQKKFISSELVDVEIARHAKAVASVETSRAEIAAAEAALERAKVDVEYTLIRAPFDGVVLSKRADVGDIVAPFAAATQSKGAVVSMADLNTLMVEADVTESNLSKVRLEQPCEIQLDALPESRFRGAVEQIVPTVDRSKATVMVKVRFIDRDSRILPEMSAKVAFLSRELSRDQQQPVTAVHGSALISGPQGDAVFLIDGGTARLTPIGTDGRLGDFLVIRDGLKPGDRVVLRPPPDLTDGSPVRLPKT